MSTEAQCVSCLAVVSTRTSFYLLHAFTRCCGELRWHHASRVPSFLISLFRILLPRMSNLLVFSAMSLCYVYAYAYPPLCISSSTTVDYLSSGTIRQISLQQDVCWRLILGYNRWYFFPPLTSLSTHCPLCNVMSILLTYAECAVGV